MMDDSLQQLLLNLKTVVEGLLSCQVPNIWNIYGALNRLHRVIEKIFKHEFRIYKQNGEEDCWIFIEGLSWLQPALASSPTPVCPNSPPSHPHTDKAMIWLHNSIETHSLSEKVSWLVSDEQHLASCYTPKAFLRHPQYVEAALICLRAIEQNQLSLLTEIHPSLYISQKSIQAQEKFHRRCSSFPESIQRTMWSSRSNSTEMHEVPKKIDTKNVSTKESMITDSKMKNQQRFYKIKPWRSLSSLNDPSKTEVSLRLERRTKTVPSSPAISNLQRLSSRVAELTPSVLKIDYSKPRDAASLRREKRAAPPTSASSGESVESTGKGNTKPVTPTQLPHNQHNHHSQPDHTRRKKKSFIEDGGGVSVKPMSTGGCHFPKPQTGQSLTSFLSSSLSSAAGAELDRENAHFCISEAIIAAIEQVKCNKLERLLDEVIEESDEEIKELKQRIRLRRKLKQEEKNRGLFTLSLSDNTNTTDQSFSPKSSDSCGSTDSLWVDDVEDMEVDQVTPTNLADISNSGLSVSMASLYSEADLMRPKDKEKSPSSWPLKKDKLSPSSIGHATSPDLANSAESVALSLLSKFHDRHLPRASDIRWLVSEKDAPQQLLPMPTSYVVNPDDAEEQDLRNATALRGNAQWAPPRPQIIFTPHPPPQRRQLMTKQNMQCAGCGMRVAPEYAHRFRYCEYLARYFCTGCHSNKQAVVPGRVIAKWDFTKYGVSNFSYNLLEQMGTDPLFTLCDINPNLYKRVKILCRTRNIRLQLYYIKDFVFTCRFATDLKADLEKENSYMLTEPEIYSLQDLIQVRSGELVQRLAQLVEKATMHVENCQLCRGRGFVCELCRSSDIIFPWQLGKVSRCSACGSCYHTVCLRKTPSCPRCQRRAGRNNAIANCWFLKGKIEVMTYSKERRRNCSKLKQTLNKKNAVLIFFKWYI
ncbi:run domain Beclin-1-interacting and cysteine-rich domain-containing protein rubicon [Rhodnius prolixus]|uniref:run domain Beclin-1-interacting and cysteine-rich domain-containing protein rubicon n=1 Tax=Rhodnius prolixus TaxID=13249 RepID=UPI003D18841A